MGDLIVAPCLIDRGSVLSAYPVPLDWDVSTFWNKVDIREPDLCWPWTAGRLSTGYGSIRIAGKHHLAHRLAYQLVIGPIPDGLTLDHLCHTRDLRCWGGRGCSHRSCVNPWQLEPVSLGDNIRRSGLHGWAELHAGKTHCSRNHELTPENLMKTKSGVRTCKKCAKIRRDLHRAGLRGGGFG